jgi:hypothetical protein
MAVKSFTEADKKAFSAKSKAEFETLVKVSNDPNANVITRTAAKEQLRKIERQNDAYNRKNNPAKYAEKLRKKAAYYDEKAQAQKLSGSKPKKK